MAGSPSSAQYRPPIAVPLRYARALRSYRSRPIHDVAIIGGGIVGVATAAFIAETGARVVLYEREGLGAGASGANSGVVQHPFDPALVALHRETVRLYRSLSEADAGFRLAPEPAGMLLVSRNGDVVVRRLADWLLASMPELMPEIVEGAALRALEPLLDPEVIACRVNIGYPVPPAASTYAYATLAERFGATIRLGRSVTPVIRDGRAVGCLVDGQLEPAGAVVVAAGPWTSELIDPSGRWRPIRPLWGVVVETALQLAPGHVLEEAEMDEALGTGEVAELPGEGGAAEPTPKFSLVTAAGASAVGSTFLDDQPDPASWVVPILSHAAEFVPSLAGAPIRSVRACARPLAADGRPLIGALPGVEGLFVCAGHGPWGISTGPGSARLVADAVLGLQPAIPPELAAGRFGGQPARPADQMNVRDRPPTHWE
jgi:glycine/D-amino acid oxidase-like deaminating enzyme